jgi:cell wall associated hydrolase
LKKRIDILNAGKSLIGFTNYKMGAKWHTHNNNINKPKLLDCSGFVVWAYKMAGFNVPDGTYHQWNNSHEISAKELQIGDIGIKEQGGLGMYNHVGIYAGDGRWIHCNYSRNGVTLEKTDIFKFYRRFNNVVFEDDKADVRKEEIKVIEKGKYIIDGKSIEMDRIMKDNMQYVKLQDLVKAGVLKAEWDNKTKITKIIK